MNEFLYVGLKAQVLALDRETGEVVWRRSLPSWNWFGDSFVTIALDNGSIFAHTVGRLYCLDAETGIIKWQNNLKGVGYGTANLATGNSWTKNAEVAQRKMQRAGKIPVLASALLFAVAIGRLLLLA
ncbi:MAG: PQQ-binding-like beta-propeller repeat protein [Desulfomonile tiedjei]|nr:PQQ-binding-like beta-propeller repeat protein [Desulfomonile tiedjei]